MHVLLINRFRFVFDVLISLYFQGEFTCALQYFDPGAGFMGMFAYMAAEGTGAGMSLI